MYLILKLRHKLRICMYEGVQAKHAPAFVLRKNSFVSFGICYYVTYKFIKLNQFHFVSRTQQVRQRELSVKTLRSRLSAEFWTH